MTSFDNLRKKVRVESEDTEISIQSITNKGDGVFVVKVNVPSLTDKPEFHSNLTKEYESNLRLIEAKYHNQLEMKDREIAIYREQNIRFDKIIDTLAQRPIHIHNIARAMSDDNRTTTIEGNVSNSQVISGDNNSANR